MDREQLKGYLYSIPERFLRSLTGLGGGAAREVSDVLLPVRVRRSRLYRSLVGSTLRFLIEQVGQIEGAYPADDEALPSDFLIRRAAGNVVELAGIASFHASPVWVLAALADLAGAGREMIGEMAEALQKEGLLEAGPRISNRGPVARRVGTYRRAAYRNGEHAPVGRRLATRRMGGHPQGGVPHPQCRDACRSIVQPMARTSA